MPQVQNRKVAHVYSERETAALTCVMWWFLRAQFFATCALYYVLCCTSQVELLTAEEQYHCLSHNISNKHERKHILIVLRFLFYRKKREESH